MLNDVAVGARCIHDNDKEKDLITTEVDVREISVHDPSEPRFTWDDFAIRLAPGNTPHVRLNVTMSMVCIALPRSDTAPFHYLLNRRPEESDDFLPIQRLPVRVHDDLRHEVADRNGHGFAANRIIQ